MDAEILSGVWTYRSFKNEPAAGIELSSVVAEEAEITFEVDAKSGEIKGMMTFLSKPPQKSDVSLSLSGAITEGSPLTVKIRDTGIPGTKTDGWIYDQIGYLAPSFPNGKDQRPALVGAVIRVVPHGDPAAHPAGWVGSFIAVKR